MAYTNLFKLFAQNSTNVRSDSDWNTNTERSSGFVSGTASNSTNVNTAIKSNSLVCVALMDLVAAKGTGSASLGLTSSTTNIKDALLDMLQNNFSFTKTENANGDTLSIAMFAGTAKTITIANSNHAASSAGLDSAGSFSTSGNSIIFTVGGRASSAFTIPYSTKAAQDENGNNIKSNYGASLTQGSSNDKVKLVSKSGASLGEVTINDVANASDAATLNGKTLTMTYDSATATLNITYN